MTGLIKMGQMYELTGSGLKPIDMTANQDLTIGTVIHWGGNMGWPAEDFAIVERLNLSFGVSYRLVSLKDGHYHQSEAYSMKRAGQEGLRHGQYMFITDRAVSLDEVQQLKLKADAVRAEDERIQAERERIRQEVEAQPLKVGDLFYDSWGYDRTSYDFIVVRTLSPSGKTAMCQRSTPAYAEDGGKMPTTEGFGDLFRLIVHNDKGKVCLRGSYPLGAGTMDFKRPGSFGRVMPWAHYHDTED